MSLPSSGWNAHLGESIEELVEVDEDLAVRNFRLPVGRRVSSLALYRAFRRLTMLYKLSQA